MLCVSRTCARKRSVLPPEGLHAVTSDTSSCSSFACFEIRSLVLITLCPRAAGCAATDLLQGGGL